MTPLQAEEQRHASAPDPLQPWQAGIVMYYPNRFTRGADDGQLVWRQWPRYDSEEHAANEADSWAEEMTHRWSFAWFPVVRRFG